MSEIGRSAVGRVAQPAREGAAAGPEHAPETGWKLPLALSLVLLWGMLGTSLAAVLKATGGRLVYALDDPYIHMAMARNLAGHGIWGILPGRFTNTSSSPLWTALLALDFRIFGPHQAAPFVLNVLAASALLVVASRALRAALPSRGLLLAALIAIVVWTPLPTLVFTGQEHVLHALATVGYALALGALLESGPEARTAGARRALLALSALLPLIRYEGLFLCAVGSALLFLAGRKRLALLAGSVAIAPIGLFGAFSAAHGWYWVPNPVLLKGNLPHAGSIAALAAFSKAWYGQAASNEHMAVLLLAALLLFAVLWRRGDRDRFVFVLAAFLPAALLHLQFAKLRWFYRYEAYLVAFGLLAIAAAGGRLLRARLPRPTARSAPAWLAVLVVGLFAVSALSDRAAEAIGRIPRASRNIWQQQMQAGLFLQRYYPGAPIAANDIGAISYLAGVDCLDLWGLASLEVARARRAGTYDRDTIGRLAREHGCRIAVVYEEWWRPGDFGGILPGRTGGLPPEWIRAGTWTISDNVVCGSPVLSFYAVDPAEAPALERNLREFNTRLPAGVVAQTGPAETGD